ncbi:hypothetical protein ABZ553_14430 [Streptomyces sparsogenes]|uniref:hypothetical protein n=1 Tax=Streptomyces sparsogenes TaxID=67365 RepID=UPI0033FB2838
MNRTYVQGVAVVLGDDPSGIAAAYGTESGREYGLLHIGDRLTLHVSQASPEALDALVAAVAELAAWKRAQDARPALKEVAA